MSTPPDPTRKTEASTSPRTPRFQALPSAPEARRPWYASTWLIIAYSAFLMTIFCIIGFIPYSETFMDAVQKTFQQLGLRSVPAEAPLAVDSPTAPVADTGPTCEVIWVQHQPDDLGKKSRATVWEQKVSDRVKASGMTPQQFYDLVVEHNPQLIQDDYEFKKGKTYFLPECR